MDEEIKRDLERQKKRRRRRRILISLLVVQIVVVIFSMGGNLLLQQFPEIEARLQIPYRTLFFLGMAAGMALTILFISLMLFFSGLWTLVRWKFKKGWMRRTIKRGVFAGFMILMSTIVVCGTAFICIPHEQWADTPGVAERVYNDVRAQLMR